MSHDTDVNFVSQLSEKIPDLTFESEDSYPFSLVRVDSENDIFSISDFLFSENQLQIVNESFFCEDVISKLPKISNAY
jgi:hypothetical protein